MTSHKKTPGLEGGQALSDAAASVETITHAGRVLQALREGPQSAAELQWRLLISHAPSAVRELRHKGIRIDSERHPWPGRPGKFIRRYRLTER